MPRHSLTDPRVQEVVTHLSGLVLRLGSVNAVAEKLSAALGGNTSRIYPNRIHGLLTDDGSRGVNTGTLELLECACATVQADELPATWAIQPEAVKAAVLAETAKGTSNPGSVVAERLAIPVGVVRALEEAAPPEPRTYRMKETQRAPDWSWQDDAVRSCLSALSNGSTKTGLVVPTGGGKTRIALKIALEWLSRSNDSSVVLWVTHRHHLRTQARRTLQALKRESALPSDEPMMLFDRIQFTMTAGVAPTIESLGQALTLVIVDEAHHAAASSYSPVLRLTDVPGLFLTATPNRLDGLPIGIDSIAYTITYRELFARGCVIEPIFDPVEDMPELDWSSPEGLRNLADYLLERTDGDFAKPLVAVSLRERATALYEALLEALDERDGHPLSADDIGFVHGDDNSRGLYTPSDFLDEFSARPAGILIATSQLVGEGFDDPSIDAAIITFPSASISQLMQVAGRALRWAPDKKTAHVIQVRESPLQYHFDQRWLYQDISDALRPELHDMTYASAEDLYAVVQEQLAKHHVPTAVCNRILEEVGKQPLGEPMHLLLSGLAYFGSNADFTARSTWGGILVTDKERERFARIFNDVSVRSNDLKDQSAYLRNYLPFDATPGSLWRSYADLVPAMEYARREILGIDYHGNRSRQYQPGHSTSWLKYISFNFAPQIPKVLEQFLEDSYNRDAILARYIDTPPRWSLVARLELPIFGSEAFLLDQSQAEWLSSQLAQLESTLSAAARQEVMADLAKWRIEIDACPLPRRLVDNIEQLLRPERREQHWLDLGQPDS